jgi:hypothetical protein
MKFAGISIKELVSYLLLIAFLLLIGLQLFKYLPKSNIEGMDNAGQTGGQQGSQTAPKSKTNNNVINYNF